MAFYSHIPKKKNNLYLYLKQAENVDPPNTSVIIVSSQSLQRSA